ncbi:MAG: hypothetical protein QMB51_02310 [Patescibacteria group bacterium]
MLEKFPSKNNKINEEQEKLLINKASELAQEYHKDQLDKEGEKYFGHLERVAKKGKNYKEIIVGYLHDILEDTDIDRNILLEEFGEEIVEALDLLNVRNYQTYSEKDKKYIIKEEDKIKYLLGIRSNRLALAVKLYDVLDNSNPERLARLDKETRERLEKKYKKYLEILLNKK